MFSVSNLVFFVVILLSVCLSVRSADKAGKTEEVWQQDISDAFDIDASTQGLQQVNLKCGANSMHVQLETEEDFTGVMYTRGSFYKQSEPCFVKTKKNGNGRLLEMSFPFDQCQTIKDGDVYTNIVVVQHDPELVMPGDAAFALECDFRKPRSIPVETTIQTKERIPYGSRITLTSPNPSAVEPEHTDALNTVHNQSDTVTFIPDNTKSTNFKGFGTVETVTLSGGEHKVKDEL